MQLNIPCIALIEDIDNVFDKKAQNSMMFSGMLSQNQSEESENNSMKMPAV
jgi:hypothetical protein